MAKQKNKKSNKKPTPKKEMSDWVAALAKQVSTTTTTTTTRNKTNTAISAVTKSKQERIEHRNAKKRRREEKRKLLNNGNSKRVDEGTENNTINKNDKKMREGGGQTPSSSYHRDADLHEKLVQMHQMEQDQSGVLLDQLCTSIEDIVHRIHPSESDDSDNEETEEDKPRKKKKRYIKPFISKESTIQGKAVSGQKMNTDIIQPRKRDYSGLGFVRPSLYIDLRDESFLPRFEREFTEHIPGFFGKQRTNAMKKQLDGGMLWRQLQEQRENKKGNTSSTTSNAKGKKKIQMNQKVDGKKLSDMTPDERVEAMIKLGMI